jgi:WD40 repeat protein
MPQERPERPGWQVRISLAVPGPDGGLTEAAIPSGGGVWVGGRWVLTCAHVVGPEPRTVMVRFSFAGGDPVPAAVAAQGWLAGAQGDLALLELGGDAPLARPAPLRPARAVAGHGCAAYGYPAGHDGGVWSESVITGQTVDRLQLTTQVPHGHQIEKGFSGSGLFDAETGAVVGLVVTRDKGKDVLGGFAIPLQAAAAAFPQLRPWMGWRLGTDQFVHQHWRPRARGVYQDTTPGWYFTGRTALLRELTEWLEHDGSPGRVVRVVTGPAGTGKSTVLAWLCALSDPQLRAEIAAARPGAVADAVAVPAAGRISAAVWARDLDADGAAVVLASALSLPVPAGAAADDVLAAIKDLDPADRACLVVVLDALDEARAPQQVVRRLLLPLARDLGVKVLVGTRPGRNDELLAAFGGRTVVYRLDDPAWFDRQDLTSYAAAYLRADFDPDLPSGYRADPEACRLVAEAIAEAAGPNFLVAGLAAHARADQPVIDVRAPGWRDTQRFPAEVGQAFDDYLTRFADDESRARDLLRAVAYAEGPGLPAEELWASMASALATPRRYGTDDLAWLLDSAADYLVETRTEDGPPVYRIFHQALIDHLRPEHKESQAQRELAKVLLQAVPPGAAGPDWAHAPPYIREHLAAHAAAAGLLDGLLEDPGFLVAANPSGLLPALDSASSPQARQVSWIYRIAADGVHTENLAERAAHLQLAAGKAGSRHMAAAFDATAELWHWTTHVLSWRPPGRYTALGSTGATETSAVTLTARGDLFVITSRSDGTLALWRTDDAGRLVPVGDPRPIYGSSPADTMAIGQLDDTMLAVTGARDSTAQLWQVGDDGLMPIGDPRPVGGRQVLAVAIGQLGAGLVAVTGGDDGTVRLWRIGSDGLAPVGTPQPGYGLNFGAVAVGQPSGRPVAVTGGADSTAQLWQVGDDGLTPAGDPQPGHGGHEVRAAALGQLDGRPVAVTGGDDGTVQLWQIGNEGLIPVGDPQPGHGRFPAGAVAIGQVGGLSVAVTGGGDGTVAVWRIGGDGLVPAIDPQRAHGGFRVDAVAVGQVGGHPVAVTSGVSGAVNLWRLDDEALAAVNAPQPGHGSFNWEAVTVGQLDGKPVAVTGGDDGMVQLWQIGTGELTPIGAPQPGHTSFSWGAVAVGQLDGKPVAVTVDGHTVRLWQVGGDGLTPIGTPQPGNGVEALALGQLDGTPLGVTGGDDGTVQLWRIGDDGLVPVGSPQPGHDTDRAGLFGVAAVGLGQLGTELAAITGGGDGTVRLWRIGGGGLIPAGDPQPGHSGYGVRAAVLWRLDDRLVAVTGGDEGTVRLWQVTNDGLIPVSDPQPGHDPSFRGVSAVAVGQLDGWPVAVTGGGDGRVRLWRISAHGLRSVPGSRIPVSSPTRSLAFLPKAALLIWSNDGVISAKLRSP